MSSHYPFPRVALALLALLCTPLISASCTDNSTSTAALQTLITSGGSGYTLVLCASQTYSLTDYLNYTDTYQEISTEGYPTDDTRATLLISGVNQSTAVSGSTAGRDYAILRNIIINGNRAEDEDINSDGDANIEFGGANQGQVIEYVKTYDPRGWSCMHINQGQLNCVNTTVQHNDIGPCGRDYFQNWADGVSLSCSASLVQYNTITDATDGGIVVFGAPYSTIRYNTIKAKTRVMIGGINLVDVMPWTPEGNFSHTVVEENTIYGGFATSMGNDTLGPNEYKAIIKMGIALGPDSWFSNQKYGANRSTGGVIQSNSLSGAFAFGMGVTSAEDFVITNNTFFGNTSFIGRYGENCTTGYKTPHPSVPLLEEDLTLVNTTISVPSSSPFTFVNGTAIGLTCFVAPDATELAWPYGGGQVNSAEGVDGQDPSGTSTGAAKTSAATATSTSTESAAGQVAGVQRDLVIAGMGMALGLIGGLSLL